MTDANTHRFEPLIRCDMKGCETLVEPHVGRCAQHERDHGKHSKARGKRGHSIPDHECATPGCTATIPERFTYCPECVARRRDLARTRKVAKRPPRPHPVAATHDNPNESENR